MVLLPVLVTVAGTPGVRAAPERQRLTATEALEIGVMADRQSIAVTLAG